MELVDAQGPEQIEIARAMFSEYERAIGVDLCFQGFAAELAGLPGAYAPPRGRLVLALDDGGAPVGCVALRPLPSDASDAGDVANVANVANVAEMKRLYVRPAARGRGLGRRLAAAMIEAARRAGYRRMRLDTLATMTEAIALYRSLGFADIPAYRPNPLPGPLYFELALV